MATKQAIKRKHILLLMPLFGILLFIVLYVVATLFYPGGSQADKYAVGFSWVNNYWCNLLNEDSINGQHNPAKPIAMAGMFILCLSMITFWLIFPIQMKFDRTLRFVIQIPGIVAMTIAFFLFTNINHDLITNLASLFGLIATIGVFVGLYKAKHLWLFKFGLINILLVLLNNYVYYSEGLIIYLPILQKITFIIFLTWICFIDVNLFRTSQESHVT